MTTLSLRDLGFVAAGQASGPTDPSFASVGLLLHGDGTNGSTTITDSSPSPKTTTALSDAKISTAQKKFGTGSIAFDGTTDGVQCNGGSDCAFGTGDFTIECWLYLNSNTKAFNAIYCSRPLNTNGAYANISYQGNGAIYFYVNNTQAILSSSGVIVTGQWQHIAVCRSGTSTRLFVNGTQVGSTYTDSTNYLNNSDRPMVGCEGINSTRNDTINGFIDDLRVTKGVARYTANFTPPTAAFPDA